MEERFIRLTFINDKNQEENIDITSLDALELIASILQQMNMVEKDNAIQVVCDNYYRDEEK